MRHHFSNFIYFFQYIFHNDVINLESRYFPTEWDENAVQKFCFRNKFYRFIFQ
jgi:hypothetical protein